MNARITELGRHAALPALGKWSSGRMQQLRDNRLADCAEALAWRA